jgi:HSP20 family molecular chaperone IbpA
MMVRHKPIQALLNNGMLEATLQEKEKTKSTGVQVEIR